MRPHSRANRAARYIRNPLSILKLENLSAAMENAPPWRRDQERLLARLSRREQLYVAELLWCCNTVLIYCNPNEDD